MDLMLSTHQAGDLAVVTVGGEVDLDTASQLSDHALAAVRDVSPHVLLDLAAVTFMDSTGLKVLLSIHKRTELAGGSFAVAAPSRSVRKILGLTGLDQTFLIYDSVADAPTAHSPTPGRS
jgi:anti-anti-sigma factor